ncbi:Inactive sodium-dependent neutral amino acid transporter B(0)AT3 [Gonioctena quinquepunctata]|nr:Inactive sodium-dependent neutral amino acid transporter B(0)AT3 [Gonioctena quinquepunctata]
MDKRKRPSGAFLIPFAIMLVLEGIPLFLIELGIGQKMRLGSLGVWNTIHPWLGGIGISSCIVTFFVALYYNVIITWCFYYLFNSFQYPLPWHSCPLDKNGTVVMECDKSSATAYFWYRTTLDASPDIEDPGFPRWWIVLCLLLSWIVVFFIVMKGIQSSGKTRKEKIQEETEKDCILNKIIKYCKEGWPCGNKINGQLKKYLPLRNRSLTKKEIRSFELDDKVLFRNYNGDKWLPGKVQQKNGSFTYTITSLDGQKMSRHIDQLLPRVVYFTSLFPYIVLTIFFIRGITLKGASDGLTHMLTPKVEKLLMPKVWLDAATQVFYSFGLAFGSLIAFGSYNTPNNNCVRDVILVSVCNAVTAIYASVVIFAILGFKAVTNHDKCNLDNMNLLMNHGFLDKSIPASQVSEYSYKHALEHANNTINVRECLLSRELDAAAEGTGLAFIVFTQAIVELPGAPFWAVIFFMMLLSLGIGSQIGILEGMLCTIFDIEILKRVSKQYITVISMIIDHPKYQAWNKEEGDVVATPYPSWVMGIAIVMILAGILPIPIVFLLRRYQILKLDVNIHEASIRRIDTTVSTKEMITDVDEQLTSPEGPCITTTNTLKNKFTIGDFEV